MKQLQLNNRSVADIFNIIFSVWCCDGDFFKLKNEHTCFHLGRNAQNRKKNWFDIEWHEQVRKIICDHLHDRYVLHYWFVS